MKTFTIFIPILILLASCDLPATSETCSSSLGRTRDASVSFDSTSSDASVVDAVSGADPAPMICHSRYTDTIPIVTSPGEESFWNFVVPAGACLAAICIQPNEDEFSLIIPPYLYYSPDRRIDLVQTTDSEGEKVNEWCAQWRELRPFPDLGAQEPKTLTIRGRTYRPQVILYY